MKNKWKIIDLVSMLAMIVYFINIGIVGALVIILYNTRTPFMYIEFFMQIILVLSILWIILITLYHFLIGSGDEK